MLTKILLPMLKLHTNFASIYIFWQTKLSASLLFNANSTIVQLYHGENKFWCDNYACFVLNQRAKWYIYLVLAHWNNSQYVDMSLNSSTLSWAEQTFFALIL